MIQHRLCRLNTSFPCSLKQRMKIGVVCPESFLPLPLPGGDTRYFCSQLFGNVAPSSGTRIVNRSAWLFGEHCRSVPSCYILMTEIEALHNEIFVGSRD